MFDFLMDDVDSSDFLLDYNSYHMSHYNIAKVDRPREMKNPQIILKGSKNELHRLVLKAYSKRLKS